MSERTHVVGESGNARTFLGVLLVGLQSRIQRETKSGLSKTHDFEAELRGAIDGTISQGLPDLAKSIIRKATALVRGYNVPRCSPLATGNRNRPMNDRCNCNTTG
jgi:hypothetical protein